MSDIIGIIAKVEDDAYGGKAHKKVTLADGQVLKVKYGREGTLKAKWDLLKVGTAIKFTMQDYTNPNGVKIPFVFDIETVEGALLSAKEPAKILPEHQKEVDKALDLVDTGYLDTTHDKDGLPLSVKLRTFCVSYAKDIVVGKMQTGDDMSTDKLVAIAIRLEKYVITGK